MYMSTKNKTPKSQQKTKINFFMTIYGILLITIMVIKKRKICSNSELQIIFRT